MSTNSLNSEDNQESGRSAWSAFSSKFQDLKQKTRNKQIELSNYARTKGSELAVYANQQSRNIMQKMKKEEQQPVEQKTKDRYVFGVPLEYVMQYSGHEYGIPTIVYDCINELTYSIDEVGLYRIPGSTHKVEVLKDKYDFLEPVSLDGEDPNTIATLLKLFIRNLPSKLSDEDHNVKLNNIITKYGIEKPEEFTEFDEIAAVLEDIPEWDYNLLGYICFHLKSVADNSDSNKMNINNLGLIFCQTLKISPAVFSILVIHSQNVFRRFLTNEDDYNNNNENNDNKCVACIVVKNGRTITDDEYNHLYKLKNGEHAKDGFKTIICNGGYSLNGFILSETPEGFEEEYPDGFIVNGYAWMSKQMDGTYIVDSNIYTDYYEAALALNNKIPPGNEICAYDEDEDGYIDRISAYYVEAFIINKIIPYSEGITTFARVTINDPGKRPYDDERFTGNSGEEIDEKEYDVSQLKVGDMGLFKYTPYGWDVIKAYEVNGILVDGKQYEYYQIDGVKYKDYRNYNHNNLIISNRCNELTNAHRYFGFINNYEDLHVSLWFVQTFKGELAAPCGFTTNKNAKAFLTKALTLSYQKIAAQRVSVDGSDVPSGISYITTSDYAILKEVIDESERVLSDPTSAPEQMDYQVYKLYLALHGSQDDKNAKLAGYEYKGFDNQIKIK